MNFRAKNLIPIVISLFLLSRGYTAMPKSTPSADKVYETWLRQLTATEKNLPQITQSAELWANNVIKEGGEVYASGDFGFWRECVHRAGGIGFIRKLTPDVVLDNKDVVLVGFEYANETNQMQVLEPILKSGATILLFAEAGADNEFKNYKQSPHQLLLIPCDKGLDGLASTESTKYITLTGMTNVLNMWVTSAEFVSACTRLNRMPNMYVSITHPRGWSINGSYFASRFYQDKAISPVAPGVLGKQYLNKIKELSQQIVNEESNLLKASEWTAKAVKENKGIHETLAGHWALNLSSNQYTPNFFNSKSRLEKDDLRISLDYNYYSPSDIERILNSGVKVIFMSTSDVDNDKFKGVKMSSNGQLLAPFSEIPKREDLLVLDGHWPLYDATITLPDYPYPFLPSSWVAHGLVHWILIGETLDILSGK